MKSDSFSSSIRRGSKTTARDVNDVLWTILFLLIEELSVITLICHPDTSHLFISLSEFFIVCILLLLENIFFSFILDGFLMLRCHLSLNRLRMDLCQVILHLSLSILCFSEGLNSSFNNLVFVCILLSFFLNVRLKHFLIMPFIIAFLNVVCFLHSV